jgi:Ca2+-binding RTX toxin-like protein
VPDSTDQCPSVPAGTLTGCPATPPGPTNGNDVLNGTAAGETICGLLGNDVIKGLGGNDTLFGDLCGVKAKPRAARAGAGGSDTIHGGTGNDKVYGAGGADKLFGDAGKDKLFGGGGNDSIDGGAGANTISGGAGNDTVKARNGKKDQIDCGTGKKDSATVDKRDKVRRCERVRRARR